MKILVGEFITESNANIPQKCEISNYKMLFGDDCNNLRTSFYMLRYAPPMRCNTEAVQYNSKSE